MPRLISSLMTLLTGCLISGCFGKVVSDVCVYNARSYYFRCGKLEVSKKRFGYISKRKNVPEARMAGAVCVPAKYWPKVYSKIVEARELCTDNNCW